MSSAETKGPALEGGGMVRALGTDTGESKPTNNCGTAGSWGRGGVRARAGERGRRRAAVGERGGEGSLGGATWTTGGG